MTVVAGTGHRPKYFPCKYNENDPWAKEIKEHLQYELDVQNADVILSGMAIGWDMWIAEAALAAGKELHCYIPFKGQGSKWPTKSKERYHNILDRANKILYTSEEYSNKAFFIRDEAMVDDCDMLFALLNPLSSSGGTLYTVNYAKKNNKPITHFWKD